MAVTPRFGPVVLAGLAGSALTLLGGSRPWVSLDPRAEQMVLGAGPGEAGRQPLAGALALVMLACWGVFLVTRGRVRRGVAALGALAAIAGLAVAAIGAGQVRDRVAASLGPAGSGVSVSSWVWTAALGSVLAALAFAFAVRFAPRWPEMGRRYDAPGGRASAPTAPPGTAAGNQQFWKALDEGEDPTR